MQLLLSENISYLLKPIESL